MTSTMTARHIVVDVAVQLPTLHSELLSAHGATVAVPIYMCIYMPESVPAHVETRLVAPCLDGSGQHD